MTTGSRDRSTLILGGARSGKSRYALELAASYGGRLVLVATAQAGDAEMAMRIARHRADRPAEWEVVEEAVNIAAVLAERAKPGNVTVVDCMTLWLCNLMEVGRDPEGATDELLAALARATGPVVIVSNETGLGIVPGTPLGRGFRDAQGLLNQALAGVCDRVLLMVAGLPLRLKPGQDLLARSREPH